MISLKQLNYALAVKETGQFNKAAELCSVSQSTLSTAISELENQLSFKIFERNNKKVLITPMGNQALAHAQSIMRQVEEIHQLSHQQDAALQYPMSIGVIPTIAPYLLPAVLPKVRELHPDFKLNIIEDQSHVLVEKVRNGEIDTAILALPYPTSGLHTFKFWQENFSMICHKSHPLAQNKNIHSDALGETLLMLLKEGHCLKDHALAACKLDPLEMNLSMSGTSLNTLIQMVAGKLGVTLIPQMALSQLVLYNPELSHIPLTDPGPHRKLAFITRLNYSGVNSIERLIEIFKKQLA